MKEELSSELISSLLGLFAHDLRNPLSALHSNVSFLGSVLGTGDNDAREGLEDVAALAQRFGGGGHAKAAGASLEGAMGEVQATVLAAAREYLRNGAAGEGPP